MPPCASGPVLTVSRPSLKGAAWAMAGAGNLNVASAAPATVPAMNLRRETLRDIAFLHCDPGRGCLFERSCSTVLLSASAAVFDADRISSRADGPTMPDQSMPIIG